MLLSYPDGEGSVRGVGKGVTMPVPPVPPVRPRLEA